VKARPLRIKTYSWEISLALLAKIILLVGLWFLIFRWHGEKPKPQKDIAAHFNLPLSAPNARDLNVPTQP
jgi:hypothetical protein